jgi:hypothetical protein
MSLRCAIFGHDWGIFGDECYRCGKTRASEYSYARLVAMVSEPYPYASLIVLPEGAHKAATSHLAVRPAPQTDSPDHQPDAG